MDGDFRPETTLIVQTVVGLYLDRYNGEEFLGTGRARAQSANVTSSLSSNELVILSFGVCLLALDSEKKNDNATREHRRAIIFSNAGEIFERLMDREICNNQY